MAPTADSPTAKRNPTRWTLALAVIVLTPSMFGFVTKFIEFAHTFRGDSGGVFAITPMINYLFASLGFLCLLVWASLNGMFHDMERPKNDMLQQESLLDAGGKHV